MKASKANLINSFSLIIFGVWGYIDSSSINEDLVNSMLINWIENQI